MSDDTRTRDERIEALLSSVQMGKFASVGVLGALSDNLMLVTLKLGLGVPEVYAKAVAIETAILVMFTVNEHWTYKDHGADGRRPLLRRLGKSHGVRAVGSTIQIIVYWALVTQLTVTLFIFGTDWWFLAASPIAIGAGMTSNYVFETLFTWRVHHD